MAQIGLRRGGRGGRGGGVGSHEDVGRRHRPKARRQVVLVPCKVYESVQGKESLGHNKAHNNKNSYNNNNINKNDDGTDNNNN